MRFAILACELCRDAASVNHADGRAAGFNSSIYLMLGGLLLVSCLAGRAMYRAGINAGAAKSPDTLRRR